jgi:hypothetical protein
MAAVLLGCAGSNGGNAAKGKASGSLRIGIHWPAKPTSRLIPLATDHIVLTFRLDGTVAKTVEIPRPTTGDTTNTTVEIREGLYDVTAEAMAADAGSAPLASATESVGVLPKESSTLDLSMNSTIVKVVLSKPSGTVRMGRTTDLIATAQDAQGRAVLVDPSKWQWHSSDSSVLGGTADGATFHLKGLALGSSTVEVDETESGTLTHGDFTVLDAPTISPLAWAAEGSVGYTHFLDTPAVGSSTKVIGQNFVYFVSNDKDGNIYTLNGHSLMTSFTPSGTQRWQINLPTGAFEKLVVLSDSSVIVSGIENNTYFIRAYKGADGSVLWNKNIEGYYFVGYSLTPTPDGKLCYIDHDDIVAIDAADGSPLWEVGTEHDAHQLSCGVTGLLAVTNGTSVLLYDSSNGSSVGNLPTLSGVAGVPVITKDTIYLHGTEPGVDGNLLAFSLDGTLKWATNVDAYEEPAVDKDGNVFVSEALSKALVKLRASDGAPLWSYPSAAIGFAPVVDGAGNVYAVTNGPDFGSLDIVSLDPNGNKRWQIHGSANQNDADAMALGPNGTLYLPGSPFIQVK